MLFKSLKLESAFQDHQLTAHVHVTHMAAGRLTPVHVHENAWTPSCNNLGGHYNLPGTAK